MTRHPTSDVPLLPKRFLFRFSVPCFYRDPLWSDEGADLGERHRLIGIGELENQPGHAEVRSGWSEAGVAFAVLVGGKSQPPWCRESRMEDSDGVQFWIDTRDVHNIHRAGRFCHSFLFLPSGSGSRLDRPVAQWVAINRAKDNPRAVRPEDLGVRARRLRDGYRLDAFLPAAALTGFDPLEHSRLGFTYAVYDRELGEQTFSAGSPMPFQEDPSLWATLELVKD